MNCDKESRSKRLFLCLIIAAFGLLSACASYTDETQAIRSAWVAGNDVQAARLAKSASEDKEKSVDAIVFLLEEGSAWRAAEEYNESDYAFHQASQKIAEYDAKAEIRLAESFTANFTNLTYLPYVGYSYDRVMLHTYKALNAMAVDSMDNARVELNRALEAQRDAVRANAELIEAAQKASKESAEQAAKRESNIYNAERAQKDARFNNNVNATYRYLNQYRVYSDYVNPFTVYLDGLYFMAQSTGLSDLERARKSFERVKGMVNYTEFVEEDIALVNRAIGGQTLEPTTYVIFETGMAPSREETRIDIPLFIVSREVPYFGVAFPKLKFNGSYIPRLTVRGGSEIRETKLVCSMDSVVAQEFENELPAIITRTLISAGTKAAAQYGIYEATKDSGTLGTLAIIAGTIYQAAMNQADLRTWITLPKQFQVARLPTPEDRRLQITPQGSPGTIDLDLQPGIINVVYIKSNSALDPPDASQFVLKHENNNNPSQLIQ
ncbi:hypothetical protein [Rubellicoccus peritrichatus]|uniref:Lipoprotein n=1 Tax=Rubellicoccus peritrichatus TaxID=3080537 RepID=A0AAQ3L9D8_9BACT|nr:hypothetical protein [Puniceicoccus sp. CR14]WOO41511.1 hypothetical protein RZN69_00320 [Puniceicoccus sp. CR14]